MDFFASNGIYKQGYGIVAKLVMRDKHLSVEAKAIYAYICSFAGSGDCSFPSRDLIISELGISKTRFYKYRQELIDAKYITVEKIRNGNRWDNNVYRLQTNINSLCPQNKDTEIFECPQIEDPQNKDTNNNNIIKERKKEESKETKQENKKHTYNEMIETYTKNKELKQAILEFIKMRKLKKAVLTDRALKLILNKLDKLATTDTEKIAILEQSILNSWTGVFPLKQFNNNFKEQAIVPKKPKVKEFA